ncbi:dipeptidyl peptidase 3 [Trichonephila clavipes]|nr:dipeptidyl peptidase 3 [Trichonephila clavipes]
MAGKIEKFGFITFSQTDVRHEILEDHCIIHHQALWAKSGFTSLDNEITVVTNIVNLISSQALNKRMFDALLGEVNSTRSSHTFRFSSCRVPDSINAGDQERCDNYIVCVKKFPKRVM